MKKLAVLLLALAMLCLCACGAKTATVYFADTYGDGSYSIGAIEGAALAVVNLEDAEAFGYESMADNEVRLAGTGWEVRCTMAEARHSDSGVSATLVFAMDATRTGEELTLTVDGNEFNVKVVEAP